MLKLIGFVGFGIVAFIATFSLFWAFVGGILGLAIAAVIEDFL
ncbi:MAG TPA: hypothetical protein PLP33_25350 [Leptospiraceae bacterium]|nr:hypothetical protein [Leptospiraceae bacterium]